MLHCPEAPNLANGYGYNAALDGKSLGDIAHPDTTPIFADSKSADGLLHSLDDIDRKRHGNGYFVAFVDGHVEFIQTDTAVKLTP